MATLQGKALQPLAKAMGSKHKQIASAARSALHNLKGNNFDTRAAAETRIKR